MIPSTHMIIENGFQGENMTSSFLRKIDSIENNFLLNEEAILEIELEKTKNKVCVSASAVGAVFGGIMSVLPAQELVNDSSPFPNVKILSLVVLGGTLTGIGFYCGAKKLEDKITIINKQIYNDRLNRLIIKNEKIKHRIKNLSVQHLNEEEEENPEILELNIAKKIIKRNILFYQHPGVSVSIKNL